jgi:hypothetical protein
MILSLCRSKSSKLYLFVCLLDWGALLWAFNIGVAALDRLFYSVLSTDEMWIVIAWLSSPPRPVSTCGLLLFVSLKLFTGCWWPGDFKGGLKAAFEFIFDMLALVSSTNFLYAELFGREPRLWFLYNSCYCWWTCRIFCGVLSRCALVASGVCYWSF